MISKKLIKQYRIINYWRAGLNRALWEHHRDAQGGSEEAKAAFMDARNLVCQAARKVDSVFEHKIGEAVLHDVRSGRR